MARSHANASPNTSSRESGIPPPPVAELFHVSKVFRSEGERLERILMDVSLAVWEGFFSYPSSTGLLLTPGSAALGLLRRHGYKAPCRVCGVCLCNSSSSALLRHQHPAAAKRLWEPLTEPGPLAKRAHR